MRRLRISARSSTASRVAQLAGAGLTAWALVRELRTPGESRTWHGRVAGVVPYDFRLPNRRRLRERLWAPDDPRLVVPRALGVGWTLNVGRLVAVFRRATR